MESDLFGGSLGRKTTPNKSSKPVKTPSDSKDRTKNDSNPSPAGDSAKLRNNTRPRSISPEPTNSTVSTSSVKGTPIRVSGSCYSNNYCIPSIRFTQRQSVRGGGGRGVMMKVVKNGHHSVLSYLPRLTTVGSLKMLTGNCSEVIWLKSEFENN